MEIIDPETEEVLPLGEFGEIVTTPLWIEGMPVIRYRTGDMAKMLEYEPCPCGRTFNRISRIKGRTTQMIKVKDAKLFPIDVEEVIQSFPELGGEYQIIVEKPGPLDILKVKAEYKPEVKERAELKRKVEKELEKATTAKSEVELVSYGELPRAAMKAQRVIRTY